MIKKRSTLQKTDRDTGLVFGWRVPVSSGGSLFFSVCVVSLLALAVSAAVRVRVGKRTVVTEERGSVVFVPESHWAAEMDRIVRESGPFPARWNPAADLEFAALRRQAQKAATDVNLPYASEPVEIALRPERMGPRSLGQAGFLPPLPASPITANAGGPEVSFVLMPVQQSDDGFGVDAKPWTIPAAESAGVGGSRFLLEYNRFGRIVEATGSAGEERPELIQWIMGAQVTGAPKRPGFLNVEVVIQP